MLYVTTAHRQVLNYYRPSALGAHRPGSFAGALISAFALADRSNFELLYSAFPEYGEAMGMAMLGHNGGIEALTQAVAEATS